MKLLPKSSAALSRGVRRAVRAFTIVEILVVLAIIGLLVGLAINNADSIFGGAQVKTARIFVRDSLKLSLVRYKIDVGDFPSTAEGLNALIAAPASKAERWKGPYIEAPGGKVPLDPWGEAYQYRFPGTRNKSSYDLYSKGEDHNDGTEDDIGNW